MGFRRVFIAIFCSSFLASCQSYRSRPSKDQKIAKPQARPSKPPPKFPRSEKKSNPRSQEVFCEGPLMNYLSNQLVPGSYMQLHFDGKNLLELTLANEQKASFDKFPLIITLSEGEKAAQIHGNRTLMARPQGEMVVPGFGQIQKIVAKVPTTKSNFVQGTLDLSTDGEKFFGGNSQMQCEFE